MSNDLELVIMAGSAGAFKPILDMVRSLPSNFSLPILIVLHRRRVVQQSIDTWLSEKSNIPIIEISDKEDIKPGIAYLCPPDYHVLIEKEKIFSLDKSELILYSRPSIDVALESAAQIFKNKVLAILLSGANRDGADGLLAIKEARGTTIVQDPKEAEFRAMPEAALALNAANLVLKLKEIKEYLLILNKPSH